MTESKFLTNHFLIAMPGLNVPFFHHAVIYICEHNQDVAMGIVINQSTDISWADVLEHMNLEVSDPSEFTQPILAGGPVRQERGFVIHSPIGQWQASLAIDQDVAITTSRDILQAIVVHEGPKDVLIALGYTGWTDGQLEKEIAHNDWLTLPMSRDLLFDIPLQDRWYEAGKRLGIDFKYQDNYLSDESGHA